LVLILCSLVHTTYKYTQNDVHNVYKIDGELRIKTFFYEFDEVRKKKFDSSPRVKITWDYKNI